MTTRRASLAASLVILVVLASSASGQPARPDVDEFGTQDGIDLWIPSSQFAEEEVEGSGSPWICCAGADVNNGYRLTNSDTSYSAVLPLPQGAFLDSWRAFFYDDSSTNNFHIELKKFYDDTTASPTATAAIVSGFTSSGTPGVTNHHQVENLTIDLREPYPGSGVTRNQAADFYAFRVQMPGDVFVAFKGVRVFWHRQVSPAPATATFNDVPGSDPAFQYVEALFASGITAGCNTSPPMYCPDAPLTRRQMAVFLSKALGLHWPPF